MDGRNVPIGVHGMDRCDKDRDTYSHPTRQICAYPEVLWRGRGARRSEHRGEPGRPRMWYTARERERIAVTRGEFISS